MTERGSAAGALHTVAYDAVDVPDLSVALDGIFFEASSVRDFADGAARERFRDRWLGRYLDHYPGEAFLAVREGRIVGYLVGCLVDPAGLALFSDIPYFKDLAPFTARWPAHLHINVAEPERGQGTGAALIAAFAQHAAAAGVGGMHIVTGVGLRNVRFYERCGFAEVARVRHGAGEVVMLARNTGLHTGLV